MKFSQQKLKLILGVWVVFLASIGIYRQQDTNDVTKSDVDADIRMMSINVHNLFNGEMLSNGQVSFARSRGADSERAYQQELKQVVRGLDASDAHLMALIEVENDIADKNPVIGDVVKHLNTAVKDEGMQFKAIGSASDQKRFGSDKITQFFLYDTNTLKKVGSLQSAFNQAQRKGRPLLLQKMKHIQSGSEFFVAVAHLKSKRGKCRSDQPGRSPCNQVRHKQVVYFSDWLEKRVKGMPVFWMGDFNGMPDESPIQVALKSGWSSDLDLEKDYSYIYRGDEQLIDYVFMKNTQAFNTSAHIWHVNTQASSGLSFSDHDAVLVDIAF